MADPLDTPKTNVSDDVTMRFYRTALLATIGADSAADILKNKRKIVRGILKDEAEAGAPAGSIERLIAMRLDDPDDYVTRMRSDIKLAHMSGYQANMMAKLMDGYHVMEPTTKEQEELDEVKAEDEGSRAGRAGHKMDSNPYFQGSLMHQAWGRGWIQGQTVIANQMVDAADDHSTTTAQPRRGRGRPPKNSALQPTEATEQPIAQDAEMPEDAAALFQE